MLIISSHSGAAICPTKDAGANSLITPPTTRTRASARTHARTHTPRQVTTPFRNRCSHGGGGGGSGGGGGGGGENEDYKCQ
jgi:hypothetical protein